MVLKLELLLVDAMIVIYSHKSGVWNELRSGCRVAVPATIINEAKFFRSKRRAKQDIDLRCQVEREEIDCFEATAEEVDAAIRDFVPAFSETIDDGEKEALGILVGGRFPGYMYCTADTPAMQAAAMLGVGDRLISMERVVLNLGLKRLLTEALPPYFSEDTLRHHLQIGQVRRITGEYFKPH